MTLSCQGQILNLLYLSQKWSDCHETKNKHIDWNLGLKCDLRVCRWPLPWPLIFKFKYGTCYVSAKNGLIFAKRTANITIEFWASNVTSGLTLAMSLTLSFQGQIWKFLYLNQKWPDCPETRSKHIDFTQGIKYNQWGWPWSWIWPLNFQGQIWPSPLTTHGLDHGSLYLRMGGPIDVEQGGLA